MNNIKRILIEIFILLAVVAIFLVTSVKKVKAAESSFQDYAHYFGYSDYVKAKIGDTVGTSDGSMTYNMACLGHSISTTVKDGVYQITDKGFEDNTKAAIALYHHFGEKADSGHETHGWRKCTSLLYGLYK